MTVAAVLRLRSANWNWGDDFRLTVSPVSCTSQLAGYSSIHCFK